MKRSKQQDLQLSLFDDSEFVVEKAGVSSKSEVNTPTSGVSESIDKKVSIKRESIPRVYNHTELFKRLSESDFRRSFHLKATDKNYIQKKGLETIRQHAVDFVAKRLAPACIPNDGKQTPMKGHPVFIAQHATACCCRGCFCKWHHIPQGRNLTAEEQDYAVDVLMTWITKEYRS